MTSGESIQYEISPWNEEYNQVAWKGKHTRGYILAESVHIMIIPKDSEDLVYFDQDKALTGERKQQYLEAVNRPPSAGRAIHDLFEWSTICMNTLGDHIQSFSQEPVDHATKDSSFHYVSTPRPEHYLNCKRKLLSQKPPVSSNIHTNLGIVLQSSDGAIYEESLEDNEVRFWNIRDPEALLEELKEVQKHISTHKVICHC